MRKFLIVTLSFCVWFSFQIKAQDDSCLADKNRRLRSIDRHKMGLGLEAAVGTDYAFLPKLYYEYGSNHSWVNASLGCKLSIENSFSGDGKDRLSNISVPLFAAVNVNIVKWQFNCIYIGVEADYGISISARHYIHEKDVTVKDNNSVQNYVVIGGRAGIRLSHMDVMLMYGYDIKPRYNQKYVYESEDYDYDSLKQVLFGRSRFTFSVIYYIPL